jgi:hypothetical protein
VELKVPVMPVMANLAENANAGRVGVVGSVAVNDWKRTKLSVGQCMCIKGSRGTHTTHQRWGQSEGSE